MEPAVASSHALGGFPDGLRALRDLAAPGGQVLLGEGYWRRPPSAANPDDPGTEVLVERARLARERMSMPGGRETLGFTLTLLQRS